jgi:hypothetical protein
MNLELANGVLQVRPTLAERILGLTGSFDVPAAQVRDVRVVPRAEAERGRGLRAPGTAFPGRIAIGRWRGRGATQYWNVRRAPNVLVLDLDGGRFDRLVLEVPDPEAVAERIRAARA